MSRWRPGDRRPDRASMVRVDQAGEYGATRIYAGQLAVMGDRTPTARTIAGMANQEEHHRAFFDALIARQGGQHVLYGSALVLAAALQAWARHAGTPLTELARTVVR